MILRENGTRFCADGKVFTIGGRISANGESEYEGLFGTITEIRSGADRETENDVPDIYVILRYPPRRKCSASWRHGFPVYTERQKP